MSYFSTHNHSSYSNLRLLDSINRLDDMIKYANEINLKGICLSEHEVLSSHVKFLNHYNKMMKEEELDPSFKVGLGNEIYLVDEEDLETLKENVANRNPDSRYYHFLLLALNKNGHFQLRQLSSIAWGNMFTSFGMERLPSFKKDLKRIINKGDVVATTACAGGLLGQMIIRMSKAESQEEFDHCKNKLKTYLDFCIDVFGKEHFYLEMQPSTNEEQIIINKAILELSKQTGLKYTIATDGHYLTKDDRHAHKTYLQSQGGEREVDLFYDATYIMSEAEVREYLISHLTEEEIQKGFDATIDIYDKMEIYDLSQDTIVPLPPIPEYELSHTLKQGYEKYEYIEKFAYSEHEIDKYFLHLVQEGLVEKIVKGRKADKEYFHICLDRINTELKEIWLISERIHQRVSAYYALTTDVVNLMWQEGDSLVGVARGSGAGFFVNFLVGISQVNPIDYDLPHFRHLTAERPELPDIDIDTEQAKRAKILQAMKDRYGYVLNIATFSTEGSRSALLSAARGMGIDIDEVNFLTSLMPVERGFTWTLSDCFYGNKDKDRKPVRELITAAEKYEGLREAALKIEGLIKSRSVHASGIYIFSDDYTKQNAMMRSKSGQETTQFDMSDSDQMGALKIDALTVQGIDRIRTAMDLLVEHGFITGEGSLRATYDKFLHPEVLTYEDDEMWDKVAENKIPDLFQFETPVGGQCVKKSKPRTVKDLGVANNLMRLMADGTEQPIDKYVRHKENIQDWYDEMASYNLTEDEVKILEEHIGYVFGCGDSQEILMLLLLDERICGFTIPEANKARKVVGKKIMEDIPVIKDMVFTKGVASDNLKNYIWDTQIVPQLGYSFSILHSTAYSLIALQEMNLAHNYPRVFWDVACLSVSAGADEDNENNKSTNYGRVAAGIGKMISNGVEVTLPLINHAHFGFTPDVENNRIVFGLKGIVGVNDELVHAIIANRPYQSFEDFYQRMYETKLVTKGQFIKLIKAGAFTEFDTPVETMKQFIIKEVDVKDKLNGQNLPRVISLGLLDTPELISFKHLYNFKSHISKSVHSKVDKPKDKILILDSYSQAFFFNNFSDESVVGWEGSQPLVSEKKFKKEYDTKMEDCMKLLESKEFIKSFNIAQFRELWNELASGSVAKWQFEANSFYEVGNHELQSVNYNKYGIADFYSLSEEPIVTEEYEWRGREMKNYQLFTIIGTVLDKNKNNHTVTVLTPEGVVVAKLYSGAFSMYDRQISKVENGKKTVVDKSWFNRGELLLLRGFRRGDQFVLKAPKGEHTINKITEVRPEDGTIGLQAERIRV